MSGKDTPPGKAQNALTRPRLVLIVDVPGWAYDNIANRISPALEADFEIIRLYVKDYPDMADLLAAMLTILPPAIQHVFWRPMLFDLLDPVLLKRCEAKQGWRAGEALERLSRCVITTSVYDHLGLDEEGAKRQAVMLSALDGYSTASPILDGIYKALPDMPAPSAMLPDGVDLEFYRPKNLERLSQTDRPFRLGWVGNSQWGFLEGIPDAKGLEGIIRPAIALLKARGLDVELSLVDRAEKWRPREEVAAFYHTLDAYLCASLVEGTPNPVLEAMTSGVPVVSTDVGIVRMCLGETQRAFIVARSAEAFADAIEKLLTTPGLRKALSDENIAAIRAHDWQNRQPDWQLFFADALRRGVTRPSELRHEALHAVAFGLKPTLKQRIRSALRRNPRAYALASKILHLATLSIAFARLRVRPALDRLASKVRKSQTDR